jgi:hypothetical protein
MRRPAPEEEDNTTTTTESIDVSVAVLGIAPHFTRV